MRPTYLVISPQGRYRVTNGRLQPAIDGPLPEQLRGKTVADFRRLLSAASAVAAGVLIGPETRTAEVHRAGGEPERHGDAARLPAAGGRG